MKLGVFGGTFDPVHTGHLIVAQEAMARLRLDEILFVPAGRPWLKEGHELTDARHRLDMVELAVKGTPGFRVSGMEIERPGPSYTADTLKRLKKDRGSDTDLYVIVGLDALNELDRWHKPGLVFELAVVVGKARPGAQQVDSDVLESVRKSASDEVVLIEGPVIDISGTDIRRRVSEGLPIRYLVPESVEAYIREHGLYGGPTGPRKAGMGNSAPRLELMERARAILELAKRKGAITFGEFQLSAGGTSPYYFDGRLITLDPEGGHRVAKAFLTLLRGSGAEAVAGPTLGADPIVSAVAAMSYAEGTPVAGLIVRKETKQHGTGRAIEGPVKAGARVAVVDDACSTGSNLLHAIEAVEAAGCQVVKVICILDRRQGGSEEIRRRGYDFASLLEADDRGLIMLSSDISSPRLPEGAQ